MTRFKKVLRGLLVSLGVICFCGGVFAQAPAEVENLTLQATGDLSWDPVATASFYNIYGASGTAAGGMGELKCQTYAHPGTFIETAAPVPGQILGWVVTAESDAGGEGTPGLDGDGLLRHVQGSCGPLLRSHTFNRIGYGWNEWSRDRLSALGGIIPYMDEQLDPSSISEAGNTLLTLKMDQYTPPVDGVDLIARQVIQAVYSRRQLEQKMGVFWFNHFNTEWTKIAGFFVEKFPDCAAGSEPSCDELFPYKAHLEAAGTQLRDLDQYKDIAFNGTFRQMLEVGTFSPAMLIYLDLYTSIVNQANENHPRELLELHSMSEAGGYTQQDVEVLSRLMTGWGVCKKAVADAGDPIASCIADYWQQPGQWTVNFDISRHDCDAKTLFIGTPQETAFPGTSRCSRAADVAVALAEFDLLLDVLADHSATKRFISMKILQVLVTDEPTEAMVDQLVAVWNDGSNPQGVGDLREITRAAVNMSLAPEYVGGKIKTPFEQFVSGMRALRGNTNGLTQILLYLRESQHVPYFNEIPTGYSEVGGDWLSTGGVLSRQNFSSQLALALPDLTFGSGIESLLQDNGITIIPENIEKIVDFFSEVLMGGALTRGERQTAIDYLYQDVAGNPDPSNMDTRLRLLVAMLMGYPQFMEQ